ncbi:MAG: hypothetical protein M1118_16210 [Chloroflexi bacterium]|nr:hypothetical protein [Chloroflexota bacterium]
MTSKSNDLAPFSAVIAALHRAAQAVDQDPGSQIDPQFVRRTRTTVLQAAASTRRPWWPGFSRTMTAHLGLAVAPGLGILLLLLLFLPSPLARAQVLAAVTDVRIVVSQILHYPLPQHSPVSRDHLESSSSRPAPAAVTATTAIPSTSASPTPRFLPGPASAGKGAATETVSPSTGTAATRITPTSGNLEQVQPPTRDHPVAPKTSEMPAKPEHANESKVTQHPAEPPPSHHAGFRETSAGDEPSATPAPSVDRNSSALPAGDQPSDTHSTGPSQKKTEQRQQDLHHGDQRGHGD